jgi:hypothetical protein
MLQKGSSKVNNPNKQLSTERRQPCSPLLSATRQRYKGQSVKEKRRGYFCVKDFLHTGHGYGLGSVCDIKCLER